MQELGRKREKEEGEHAQATDDPEPILPFASERTQREKIQRIGPNYVEVVFGSQVIGCEPKEEHQTAPQANDHKKQAIQDTDKAFIF